MSRLFRLTLSLSLLLICTLLVFVPPALAQRTKRLVMKDGSFQAIVRYEIKGNRVRYLSAERYEWEEVPKDLVDWPATQKYEQDLASGVESPDAKEADAEEQAERAAEEAKTPLVAPGLHLPSNGGVFLLDTYRNQPQLDEIVQNGGEINKDTGKNVLRAAINPIASAKQSIELKGLHARVQSHVPRPEIFVNVDTGTDASPATPSKTAPDPKAGHAATYASEHFRIVRLQPKKDSRVVGAIKISMLGNVSQQQSLVPSKAEPLSADWVKIMPDQPLTPGEYAVVEMLGEKEINLYVWDFGVNPTAPANPTAWTPTPAPADAGTKQPPALHKRESE